MNTVSEDQLKKYLEQLGKLREYLLTNIVINGTTVKITANNTAPCESGIPRVVFTGVGLGIAYDGETYGERGRSSLKMNKSGDTNSISTSARLKDEKYLGLLQINYARTDAKRFDDTTPYESQQGEILFPGQYISWEMDVPLKDLPYTQFKVEGTLSRRHLFHNEYVLKISDSIVRPLAEEALRSYNDLQIHKVLVEINQDRVFDGNTTLSEIQKYGNTLASGIAEIESILKKINEIWYKYQFNWFRAHLRATFIYLESVKVTSKKLQEAIYSVKPDLIHAEANKILGLIEEAYQLNRETEELMAKYQLSDQEVNYQYRFGIGSLDRDAEQHLQGSFGNEWVALPDLVKRSLVNANRTWAAGSNCRFESILDDLKVAAEQLLLHGLLNQLEQWEGFKELQGWQKQKIINLKSADSQPDLLDFQRTIEFPITNAYLKTRGISEEDRKWFVEQLPDSLYRLRKARNDAVHPDPANIWTREKLKPYVEEFLGIDKQGILQRIAVILF